MRVDLILTCGLDVLLTTVTKLDVILTKLDDAQTRSQREGLCVWSK
jgi:hypothetical protein